MAVDLPQPHCPQEESPRFRPALQTEGLALAESAPVPQPFLALVSVCGWFVCDAVVITHNFQLCSLESARGSDSEDEVLRMKRKNAIASDSEADSDAELPKGTCHLHCYPCPS